MRTKTLLLTAALCVAGVASSMAQSNVYSLNIVGYVNVPVTANHFYLIENPLSSTPNNNVTNAIQLTDNWDSTVLYTFTGGVLSPAETYFAGFGWYPGTTVINPGTGFYLYPTTNGTVTFTGSVQTNNAITLPPGFSLVASAFPASTNLVSLGVTGADSDVIYRFNSAAGALNDLNTFFAGYGWYASNLGDGGNTNGFSPAVGEAFFYFNANAVNHWNQNFTVQ